MHKTIHYYMEDQEQTIKSKLFFQIKKVDKCIYRLQAEYCTLCIGQLHSLHLALLQSPKNLQTIISNERMVVSNQKVKCQRHFRWFFKT